MDILTLSRIQFGGTAAFHIIWPLLSIGLGLYLFVLEALWLKTKDEGYYRQLRFWLKIFILTFVMGTASGIPLEFEFGTNWAAFSSAAGDFFGNILGFETTVAFALEAAFLGIFAFGWKRVRPGVHLFANAMVALGASLSAFWIMVANSWMQTPTGVTLENGRIIVTDYWEAIFNPAALISFLHMWFACVEATLFFIMGIAALAILWTLKDTGNEDEADAAARRRFFLSSFQIALVIAVVVAPLQIFLGDVSGQVVGVHQPEKLAALELHWDTNPAGTGAGWSLLAWPAKEGGYNVFSLELPYGLSLITTRTLTGEVRGLSDFPADSRPTVTESLITFYSFRLMILCGVTMFFLALAGTWYLWTGRLRLESLPRRRTFFRLFALALPLGIIATEAGWMVREIGRQPWVVYHLLRTKDGLSPNLSLAPVASSTVLFGLFYAVFIVAFAYFTYRVVRKGPDLSGPVIGYTPRHAAANGSAKEPHL